MVNTYLILFSARTPIVLFFLLIGICSINFFDSNIIYRIINLGVLCILFVSLWSFYFDSNFILLLYLLIFVGAIVIFFLSIIMMLPNVANTSQQLGMIGVIVVLTSIIFSLFIGNIGLFLGFSLILGSLYIGTGPNKIKQEVFNLKQVCTRFLSFVLAKEDLKAVFLTNSRVSKNLDRARVLLSVKVLQCNNDQYSLQNQKFITKFNRR
jgi:NADH:ubiquinone oxidoreductase subunit 6 (subunit J)